MVDRHPRTAEILALEVTLVEEMGGRQIGRLSERHSRGVEDVEVEVGARADSRMDQPEVGRRVGGEVDRVVREGKVAARSDERSVGARCRVCRAVKRGVNRCR